MIRCARSSTLLCLLSLVPACASQGIPLSEADLEAARQAVAAEAWDTAHDLLTDHDVRDFDLATRREYNLLVARTAEAQNDWQRAVRFYEAGMFLSGPADESLEVERKLLEYGRRLLAGELKVFFIFTDRSRGVVTMEAVAFSGRFAETRSQALAELAQYRWNQRDFRDAAAYYAALLSPDLVGQGWDDLASFRLAMSQYEQTKAGALYGSGIREALDQLEAYLENFPGGLHRIEAEEAHAQSREMLAQYHLKIGDFYRRIDNQQGARYHYTPRRRQGGRPRQRRGVRAGHRHRPPPRPRSRAWPNWTRRGDALLRRPAPRRAPRRAGLRLPDGAALRRRRPHGLGPHPGQPDRLERHRSRTRRRAARGPAAATRRASRRRRARPDPRRRDRRRLARRPGQRAHPAARPWAPGA